MKYQGTDREGITHIGKLIKRDNNKNSFLFDATGNWDEIFAKSWDYFIVDSENIEHKVDYYSIKKVGETSEQAPT